MFHSFTPMHWQLRPTFLLVLYYCRRGYLYSTIWRCIFVPRFYIVSTLLLFLMPSYLDDQRGKHKTNYASFYRRVTLPQVSPMFKCLLTLPASCDLFPLAGDLADFYCQSCWAMTVHIFMIYVPVTLLPNRLKVPFLISSVLHIDTRIIQCCSHKLRSHIHDNTSLALRLRHMLWFYACMTCNISPCPKNNSPTMSFPFASEYTLLGNVFDNRRADQRLETHIRYQYNTSKMLCTRQYPYLLVKNIQKTHLTNDQHLFTTIE